MVWWPDVPTMAANTLNNGSPPRRGSVQSGRANMLLGGDDNDGRINRIRRLYSGATPYGDCLSWGTRCESERQLDSQFVPRLVIPYRKNRIGGRVNCIAEHIA